MLEALLLTGLVSQDGGGEVDMGQVPFTPITPPRSQELCGLPPGTGNHLSGSAACPHRPQGDHLISSSLSHSRDSPMVFCKSISLYFCMLSLSVF